MIRYFLTSVCIILAVVACDWKPAEQAQSDFDQLCKIYEGIVQQPIEQGIKEMKIAETIQKQLPVFFEQNYVHIATADMNKRYMLIKQLAESTAGSNWECDEMETYYEGGYDKLP